MAEEPTELSLADRRLMLDVAREAIAAHLYGEIYEPPEDAPAYLYERGSCFVTLRIEGKLRGCIGSLEVTEALLENMAANAINAAFHDPRFPALTREEFAKLDIHISILTPAQPVDSSDDIEVGWHGIILEKNRLRAVFLPEVATEQGWDLATTLEHLCLKAGLPLDAWKSAAFSVFETISFGEDESEDE